MMTEIALNVLDVTENSVRADASLVHVSVAADTRADRMVILIEDDGCGMTAEQVASVEDPFSLHVRLVRLDWASRFISMRPLPQAVIFPSHPKSAWERRSGRNLYFPMLTACLLVICAAPCTHSSHSTRILTLYIHIRSMTGRLL